MGLVIDLSVWEKKVARQIVIEISLSISQEARDYGEVWHLKLIGWTDIAFGFEFGK
jgi:hypothetical protein